MREPADENLAKILKIVGELDPLLNTVESATYKHAARTKLLVTVKKLEALANNLKRKIEYEKTNG